MSVLPDIWRSVPDNWVLRVGIAETVAELIAIARDGAGRPEPYVPHPKGTVIAIGEITGAQSARALVEGIAYRLAKIGARPERVASCTITPLRGHAARLRWDVLQQLFKAAGLSLRVASGPAREQTLRVWRQAIADAPKLYASPACPILLRGDENALRAICIALQDN